MRSLEPNPLDDGIDRHLWITGLHDTITIFSTLRWEKESPMVKALDDLVASIAHLVLKKPIPQAAQR